MREDIRRDMGYLFALFARKHHLHRRFQRMILLFRVAIGTIIPLFATRCAHRHLTTPKRHITWINRSHRDIIMEQGTRNIVVTSNVHACGHIVGCAYLRIQNVFAHGGDRASLRRRDDRPCTTSAHIQCTTLFIVSLLR